MVIPYKFIVYVLSPSGPPMWRSGLVLIPMAVLLGGVSLNRDGERQRTAARVGRLEIDYLNKKYDLEIPEGEGFETLAGFIFHNHENIPIPNEEIIVPPFTFTIMYVKDNRIELVRLKIDRKED